MAADPSIIERFAEYERQRAAIIQSTAALGEDEWGWSPGANVWSVGQIVEHLVLSDEQVGRPQDRARVANEPFLFRLIPRAARRDFVLRAFQNDRVLPLPSPTLEPHGGIERRALIARWDDVRAAMGRELAALPPDARYFHRLLGPLSAAQMLEIGQAHTAYHTRQIEASMRQSAAHRVSAAR